MQLSRKERFLLIVLLAMVILLGGYKFLIEPEIKALKASLSSYNEAKIVKSDALNALARAETIVSENEALVKKVEDETANFFPNLESDRLQVYFNDIASKSGINILSFSMSNKTIEEIDKVNDSKTYKDYGTKEKANSIREIDGREPIDKSTAVTPEEGSASQNTEKMFEAVQTTLQFECPYQNVLLFVDEIKNSNRTAYMSSFAINGLPNGNAAITAVVKCYGTVKVTDTDELIADNLQGSAGKENPFN